MLYFYGNEKPKVMEALELRGLVKNYVNTADERLLRVIKAVVESYKGDSLDWWDEMSEDEKKEIEIGLLQSDKGEVVPHNDVMKAFNRWH